MLFALTLCAGTLAAVRPAAAESAPRAGFAAVDARPADGAVFAPAPAGAAVAASASSDARTASGSGAPARGADSLAASAAELDRLFTAALEKLAAAGLDKPVDGAEADAPARKAGAGSSGRSAGAGKRADRRKAASKVDARAAAAVEKRAAAVPGGDSRAAAASALDTRAAAALEKRDSVVSALDTRTAAVESESLAADAASGTPSPAADSGAFVAAAPHERSRLREFLPRFHRIDREIDRGRFVYRGEVILGMTASYGTLSSEDTDFLTIIDNINLSGTITSVQPFFGYHYRDNRCVGIRLGYHYLKGDLGNVDLDLGEQNDISLNISEMALKSVSYSFALFHRSYVGIDPRGRLGLFSEVEASVTSGTSDFFNNSGETRKATYSDVLRLKLAFNPGMAIYIFPNVCATVSVGLGGLQYNSVRQHDAEGNRTGSRRASKMRFRLNIADINFGLVIHLWDKKREQ